jgi:hypothetical protein
MSQERLLRLADNIAAHGPNITYPSRQAAQEVRNVVRELAAALRPSAGGVPMLELAQLIEDDPEWFVTEFDDQMLIDALRFTAAARTEPQAARTLAIELAYGLLWSVGIDRATHDGQALYLARKALLEHLDKDGQARGITAARDAMTNTPPLTRPQSNPVENTGDSQ